MKSRLQRHELIVRHPPVIKGTKGVSEQAPCPVFSLHPPEVIKQLSSGAAEDFMRAARLPKCKQKDAAPNQTRYRGAPLD
jgi:hypothetical protein